MHDRQPGTRSHGSGEQPDRIYRDEFVALIDGDQDLRLELERLGTPQTEPPEDGEWWPDVVDPADPDGQTRADYRRFQPPLQVCGGQ